MLWLKAFHLIFSFTWFAGLLYLPRLFVYHALCTDLPGQERFKVMERKLYFGILMPGGILTIVFGLWMLVSYAWELYAGSLWLHVKLGLILLLIAYHVYCGKLVMTFRRDRNTKSHVFYRWFNEIPALLLVAIVILAVVRPF